MFMQIVHERCLAAFFVEPSMERKMSRLRALLSVSDKSGLIEFARQLNGAGVELIATGGSAKQIADAGISVRSVESLTGFPEILGGRVKTLHPAVHGGILARRTAEHLAELNEHDLAPIDLVVVNLYPFQQTVAQADITLADAIEQIDIGGVALLRAAAKNHESVSVICDPRDYAEVASALSAGEISGELRQRLALKAFQHTAAYDGAISAYLAKQIDPANEAESTLPETINLKLVQVQQNRYGENPHQQGGLYAIADDMANGSVQPAFEQLHGKEMSYNNWLDLDGSWLSAQDFADPTVSIVKHGNPCGLASGKTLADAYQKALASDPVSAFGSIVSVNRPLDRETAEMLSELFVEVIAATDYEADALELLKKKKNLRLLQANPIIAQKLTLRTIYGGLLVQELDQSQADMDPSTWRVASKKEPLPEQLADMVFAWRVARHVKSNAIIFARNQATVGIGAGQMSRIDSVMLAGHKAGKRAAGSVMASDAFFPFADGIEAAAKYGIVALVQPGGSVRDDEVIAAADRLGLVMAFTGTRHFKH